jgi:hypothetical protein
MYVALSRLWGRWLVYFEGLAPLAAGGGEESFETASSFTRKCD